MTDPVPPRHARWAGSNRPDRHTFDQAIGHTMGRISPQAQHVIDVMRTLGIPRREWSVRTLTTIVRHEGERWREYGCALLSCYSTTAHRIVVENSQRLADAGLSVTLLIGTDGSVHAIVTSEPNPRRVVERWEL